MARAAAAPARAPARQAPPPPAQETEQSVYEEVWAAVTSIDPDFPGPSQQEDDNTFLYRLVHAASELPPEVTLSPEAEAWYNAAAGEYQNNAEITPPQGYGDDDPGEQGNGAAEPAPPAKLSPADRMRQINAQRAAAKQQAAPAAARPAPTRAAPAPARAAPQRGGAPQRAAAPAPAPAAPRRGLAPSAPRQAAPAPTRRAVAPAAPAQQEDTGPSMSSLMRRYIIQYYGQEGADVDADEVMAYITGEGLNPKPSSVAGVLTACKSTIDEIKEMGFWK